jgi:uncharacterized phosphatase
MKIYVIRHGLTEMNKKGIFNGTIDEDLSVEGLEQAKVVASSVPKDIKHIYSSSLKRAKQTAEILNTFLKVPISFYDELMEVNMGDFNGQVFTEERKKKHKSLQYDWRSAGGESLSEVKERVLNLLREVKKQSKDGEALLVTHGGIVRLLSFLEAGKLLDEVGNVSIQSFDLDKILTNSSL